MWVEGRRLLQAKLIPWKMLLSAMKNGRYPAGGSGAVIPKIICFWLHLGPLPAPGPWGLWGQGKAPPTWPRGATQAAGGSPALRLVVCLERVRAEWGQRPAHHPLRPLQPLPPSPPFSVSPTACPGWGLSKTKQKHPCLSPGGACGKCARIPSGHPTRGRISVDTSWGMHLSTLGQRGHPNLPLQMGRPRPAGRSSERVRCEPRLAARPWGRCGRKPRTPARVGTAPKIHPLPGPCHRERQSPEPQGPPQARATPSERQLPCR